METTSKEWTNWKKNDFHPGPLSSWKYKMMDQIHSQPRKKNTITCLEKTAQYQLSQLNPYIPMLTDFLETLLINTD
jgi:hypothetical protein